MRFSDLLDNFILSEHKCAVYRELISYIGNFIPDDAGSAKDLFDETCVQSKVSVDAFRVVRQELLDFSMLEQSKLNSNKTLEVPKEEGKAKKKPAKKPKKKSGNKKIAKKKKPKK